MAPTVAEPMAKKKAPRRTEPESAGRKPMIVQIRGSEEYKAWAEAIAEKEGFTVAMLFERALRKFAKEGGHPDPPKR
jgi:hypothetical protein